MAKFRGLKLCRRAMIWLGPILLLISSFYWAKPAVEPMRTVDVVFLLIGIIGAVLLIPLVLYLLNFNVWVTTAIGIWSIGLAFYILSRLTKITGVLIFLIAASQLLWMLFVWWWAGTNDVEKRRKFRREAKTDELQKAIGRPDASFYKWSRFTTGILFVLTMTLAYWVALSAKYCGSYVTIIITVIWAMSFVSFLFSLCIAMLPTLTMQSLLNRTEIRKRTSRLIFFYFILGVFICWIIALIISVFIKLNRIWLLSGMLALFWGIGCCIWSKHIQSVFRKCEGVDFHKLVKERLRSSTVKD